MGSGKFELFLRNCIFHIYYVISINFIQNSFSFVFIFIAVRWFWGTNIFDQSKYLLEWAKLLFLLFSFFSLFSHAKFHFIKHLLTILKLIFFSLSRLFFLFHFFILSFNSFHFFFSFFSSVNCFGRSGTLLCCFPRQFGIVVFIFFIRLFHRLILFYHYRFILFLILSSLNPRKLWNNWFIQFTSLARFQYIKNLLIYKFWVYSAFPHTPPNVLRPNLTLVWIFSSKFFGNLFEVFFVYFC